MVCDIPMIIKPMAPKTPMMQPTPAAVPTDSIIDRPHSVIVITMGVPPPMPSNADTPPITTPRLARTIPVGN